jgi:hypothetical protein
MMEALQEVQKRGDTMMAGIQSQRKILLSLQGQVVPWIYCFSNETSSKMRF